MKAILLAAGRSTRMDPVADKNALNFFGKPLIVHQLDALISAGYKEVALVGGIHNLEFLQIIAGKLKFRAKIAVIEQKNLDQGMAGAVLSSKEWLGGNPVLVMSGNDVVDSSAFSKFKRPSKSGLLLAKKVTSYFSGGYLKVEKEGRITHIIEKPPVDKVPSDLVNIVVHWHPDSALLIQLLEQSASSRDDHYEQALQKIFGHLEYRAVEYEGAWQPIKFPWHVLQMMDRYLGQCKKRRPDQVYIAKTAVLNGPVFLEKGVRVLDNAVIQGPCYIGRNTVIATNALVRNSHIGNDCVIGFGSEVARSYVGDGVWTHTNYIGDSVIGNNVSFGAGTVTGNLRLDEGTIAVDIKGSRVDSGMTKLGIITGDDVRVGINTSFMPGVKIGSNSMIGAGITVAKDVSVNSLVYGKTELITKENKKQIKERSKY